MKRSVGCRFAEPDNDGRRLCDNDTTAQIQRRVNADVNAIVLDLSSASDLQLTADQWTELSGKLEAASATLQHLSEKMVAEKNSGNDGFAKMFQARVTL